MPAVNPDRVKIWRALSTLFLDTEIDDTDFAFIARVIAETDYSISEVQNILWGEVFPVLKANLISVAGEWAGWTDEWLVENITPRDGPVSVSKGVFAKEIGRCWKQVASPLPQDRLDTR